MLFGPSGNVHDPQKPFYSTLDTPNYSKQSEESRIISDHIFLEISTYQKRNVWKHNACRNNTLRSVLSIRVNLECGTNLFQKIKWTSCIFQLD